MSTNWEDLSATVAKVAPLVGTLLGGPAGAAVGGLIASTLGVDATPAAISSVIADPETAAKLRQFELDNKVKLKELALRHAATVIRIEAEDRSNAREMFKVTRSQVPAILAIGITLGFFGVLGLMLVGLWKPESNEALLILLGALGTSWGSVVNFYFGSSHSSQQKNELLAQSQPHR